MIAPKTLARFWQKVDKTETCWLWTGYCWRGYGRFYFNSRPILAHRFSFEITHGPIPGGMEIDHLCKVCHCVNPSHMELVPHVVNLKRGDIFKIGLFQKSKTRCPKGHLYDEANTYYDKKGRQCKACKIERQRERRRKIKNGT